MHLLRRQENVDLMVELKPRFDAVIVDEAHHMRNFGTATNHLGETLSGFTDTLVFLTATPLNLGERDFFELIRLLVPEEFDEFETFTSMLEPNEHLNQAVRDPPRRLAARLRQGARDRPRGGANKPRTTARAAARLPRGGHKARASGRRPGRQPRRLRAGPASPDRAQHPVARVHAHAQARGLEVVPDSPRPQGAGGLHGRGDGVLRAAHPLGDRDLLGHADGLHPHGLSGAGGELPAGVRPEARRDAQPVRDRVHGG